MHSAVTNEERGIIIKDLQEGDALVTMDFAQKWNPKWHHEKQCDYFGKKGISYHVSHVTARIEGIYVQHSFVHIYEGSVTQDSRLVVLTMSHFLPELKKVGVQKVYLRSDNAGAYHCAATIGSLHWLAESTGMQIGSYTFSEAQNGKGASDRDANRVKRKANEFVNQGGNCRTSEEFFYALKMNPPNGVSIYHGNVTITNQGETKWAGISNLNYFVVEKNGIRARRYGDIGQGTLMQTSKFVPINGTFAFSKAGSVASNVDPETEKIAVMKGLPTKFWYFPKCATTSTCLKEPDELSHAESDDVRSSSIGDLYYCPHPGCASTFLKISNLENHILKGQHRVMPEKFTETDYALNLFSRNLEQISNNNLCPLIDEAVEKMKETRPQESLKQGWALPKKRTSKPFGKKVIEFLLECFNKGVKDNRPMTPLVASKLMRSAKTEDGSPRFTLDELKSPGQIGNFFSREADKRRHADMSSITCGTTNTTIQNLAPKSNTTHSSLPHHKKRQHRSADKSHFEDYTEPEDEHQDAGMIRFTKLEEFWTQEDEFYHAIINKEEGIFLD